MLLENRIFFFWSARRENNDSGGRVVVRHFLRSCPSRSSLVRLGGAAKRRGVYPAILVRQTKRQTVVFGCWPIS